MKLRIGLFLVVALVLAACNGASDGAATLGTADTDLGTVLTDDSGRTLYVFDVDEGTTSNCYDDCEEAWPVVEAGLEAGDADVTLGSTTRDDGTEQLTINGRPVYLFSGDSAEGDVNGQGVNDVWWVLDTSGEAVAG